MFGEKFFGKRKNEGFKRSDGQNIQSEQDINLEEMTGEMVSENWKERRALILKKSREYFKELGLEIGNKVKVGKDPRSYIATIKSFGAVIENSEAIDIAYNNDKPLYYAILDKGNGLEETVDVEFFLNGTVRKIK